MIDWAQAKQRGWQARSSHAQVEKTIWWSLGGLPWIMYVAGTPQLLPRIAAEPLPRVLAWSLVALTAVTCAVGVRALRQALECYLGAAPFPRTSVLVLTAGTTVTVALLTALVAVDGITNMGAVAAMSFVTVTPLLGPLALLLPPRRAVLGSVALSVVLLGLFGAVGTPWRALLVTAALLTFSGVVVLSTARMSGWHLTVMRELDEARDVQARLAVAEERLRFGRDLHDVMGRNMSVIALKSELAVRLARRGADSAADQMVEVQRIARDSQREIQDVVRGYREADLFTELAGARSILRAAGIDCRTEVGRTGAGGVGSGGRRTGVGARDGGVAGAEELPAPVRSALGWVVREGTTNVLRHANASHCVVRLRLTGEGAGTAVLTMENDGVGDDRTGGSGAGGVGAGGAVPGGSGLAGLRERLAELGGTLSTERVGDGNAYRLTACVPLAGPGGAVGTADGAAVAGGAVGTGRGTAPGDDASYDSGGHDGGTSGGGRPFQRGEAR
ncbi:histidine kinase [Streptomyces sp. Z26]|uniref:sensor histidine kinase n=1 Tax=Streptomyces sp. Z26 TaxID=2500177 RepID=UPI0023E89D54|nr:histidine kinase [Streptomyces sp. Z26]